MMMVYRYHPDCTPKIISCHQEEDAYYHVRGRGWVGSVAWAFARRSSFAGYITYSSISAYILEKAGTLEVDG